MFKTEKELVKKIKLSIENDKKNKLISNKHNLGIYKEVDLGYGIADIVLVQYLRKEVNRKYFLDFFDISILKIIQNNTEMDIDILKEMTRASRIRITKTLKKLQIDGFINNEGNKYISVKKYKPILNNSVAIEAKLSNWKRALKQAYRYNWFSNKSFVFLPSENIASAKKNLILFKKFNVGLASIDLEGKIVVNFNPKKTDPFSEKMSYLLNEQLLRTLHQKRIPSR